MCMSSPRMPTPPTPPQPASAPPAPEPLAQGVRPTAISRSRLAAYGGLSSSLLRRLRIPLGGTSLGGVT